MAYIRFTNGWIVTSFIASFIFDDGAIYRADIHAEI